MAAPESRALRRSTRERDLVAATRRLFDERGMQDAPIEEIARAVGIARGLVYRHFSSKDELFVLTVTDYLDELGPLLETAIEEVADPVAALERCAEAFAGFCQRYPAFLDSSMSLMQRSARELREVVSESVWLRLGQSMSRCLQVLIGVLERGVAARVFAIEDPAFTANLLWTQTLGAMHLTRLGVGVRRQGGFPDIFALAPERVVGACVESALATVRARA